MTNPWEDEWEEEDEEDFSFSDDGPDVPHLHRSTHHVMPITEHHTPSAFCWCVPDLVIPCCCDDDTPGRPVRHCPMCLGTGYIKAHVDTYTLGIHYDTYGKAPL